MHQISGFTVDDLVPSITAALDARAEADEQAGVAIHDKDHLPIAVLGVVRELHNLNESIARLNTTSQQNMEKVVDALNYIGSRLREIEANMPE